MFLAETNLYKLIKQQYCHKFKAYTNLLWALIVVQIIAVLSSLGGFAGMSGTGGNGVSVHVYRYSSNLAIIYTLIWAVVCAFISTGRTYKNYDFAFVSTRLSSNVSTIAFLLTAGFAGGIMASISGVMLRVITFFTLGSQNLSHEYFLIPPADLLTGILAATVYIIFALGFGYFVGTLAQVNLALVAVLPMLFILGMRLNSVREFFLDAYLRESSLLLFSIRVIATAAMLLWAAVLMSNRLEVRG